MAERRPVDTNYTISFDSASGVVSVDGNTYTGAATLNPCNSL